MAQEPNATRAKVILGTLFRGCTSNLSIRLWNGETLHFGDGAAEATLVFRSAKPLRDLILLRDPVRLADAYFRGMVDVEGDIYAVLGLKDHFRSLTLSASDRVSLVTKALFLRDVHGNESDLRHARDSWLPHGSRGRNRQAIAFHYDVSNDFYRLWLDREMVYSCAYFQHLNDGLDQAQQNKLDHICRKLRLKPGERLLDVGCGWGALVRWAARHYGVFAYGVTLSRKQWEYGQRKIQEDGLEGRVTIALQDYRDIPGEATFDKVASVGMFEHVGLKNLPLYFQTVHRLLRPGGLFLNHGITHDVDGWRKSVSKRFINRYVFPDGELDRVSNIQRVMEQSPFEILDVEGLRPHYALTLRHWVERLEKHREEALQHVSEAIYRVWRLYMATCVLAFEEGGTGVYQILASKTPAGNPPAVPLTRQDLYS